MSKLSKYINLLIEFGEKIEGHVNKKYKPFIRGILKVDSLSKEVPNITITNELIVFKLGLEAKSPKAVEISLNYLVKLFGLKAIDINQPNYCENYVIEDSGVKEVPAESIKTQIRHEIISLIRKNLIYKSNDIHHLSLKVLQFLIAEPVLPIILEISQLYPHQLTQNVLRNYLAFRSYVFEEICCYKEAQMQRFNAYTLKNDSIDKQIKNAWSQHDALKGLVGRYMNEYLSIVEKSGGKYGSCVMCSKPADHYCKITKASLCSVDCKNEHLALAQKQYKNYFHGVNLWNSVYTSYEDLLIFLENNKSPLVFGVLASLLDKPHLFMVIKDQFRSLIGRHAPLIFDRVLRYLNEEYFEHIYVFMVSLAKFYLRECLPLIEYFFKEHILGVLEQKKPSPRLLNHVFRALGKLFEHGKVFIQLYVNYDCQVNKQNIIERALFEIARIVQDRFNHGGPLPRQQRIAAKNHALSLMIILSIGLNEYRKSELLETDTGYMVQLKQRKMSLEQFVVRFNQEWTKGLKTLFNLNLVGLDSNEEIVDILLHQKGLKKVNIDDLLSCEKGQELFKIFTRKLKERQRKSLLLTLLDFFHYIPLKPSVTIKRFISFLAKDERTETQAQNWVDFLIRPFSQQQLVKVLGKDGESIEKAEMEQLMRFVSQIRQPITTGNTKPYFTFCCSRSYLDVLNSQLSLLQIPLSYMLQTDYEVERVISLIEELVQVCPHSNWMSLLVKSTAVSKYPGPQFDDSKLKLVKGAFKIIETQAAHIQDWSAIVNWLSFLRHTVLKVDYKNSEHNIVLAEEVKSSTIEHCLMEASSKASHHFEKLLLAVLVVAKEDLEKESLFLVQKFFEMVQLNGRKFAKIIDTFIPYLVTFATQLQGINTDHVISITDMLKQSFAKLLKLPREGNAWTKSQFQFFVIFESISAQSSRELNEFIVNCINMTIFHHFDLTPESWKIIFRFMSKKVSEYRQQIYSILEKVVTEQLRGCEEFFDHIIDLCFELIHPTETKISNEALHLLSKTLELVGEIKWTDSSKTEEALEAIKETLKKVLGLLVQRLYYGCHEQVIILFFHLLTIQVNDQSLLSEAYTQHILSAFFTKVEDYIEETIPISQKAINVGLKWAITNSYPNYVSFLQSLIINKYHKLSYSATRCLKTYIQMLNPKTKQEWQHIQDSLLAILQNTHISDMMDLSIQDAFKDYNQPIQLNDSLVRTDINLFANKMIVQRSLIEMLPNHEECVPELEQLHKQVTQFNDNLYLRCLLWRRGLGKENTVHPPNLLALEEAIMNKLVFTYYTAQEESMFPFGVDVFQRYCAAAAMLGKVSEDEKLAVIEREKQRMEEAAREKDSQEKQGQEEEGKQWYHWQNYDLMLEYLRLRRTPLLKIMNYYLPKIKKVCREPVQKRVMVLKLVESCKYVETRDVFLKAIRDLTIKS